MLTREEIKYIRQFAESRRLILESVSPSNIHEYHKGHTVVTFAKKENEDDTYSYILLEDIDSIEGPKYTNMDRNIGKMFSQVLKWLKETRREELPVETKQHNSEWVDYLISAAKDIIKNAESIVGTEERCTDLTVSIYIYPGEVPRINVDRNIAVDVGGK